MPDFRAWLLPDAGVAKGAKSTTTANWPITGPLLQR